MSTKRKVRNMRNEYIYSFVWNLLAIFSVLFIGELIFPSAGPIGSRTMLTLYIVDGGLTLLFMHWMEKYTTTISGVYEKSVISVLSNLYTFFVMILINIFFFTSLTKFIIDIVSMGGKIIALISTDFILDKIRSNKNIYVTPKLLIIGTSAKNFDRMKRIKYGVLKNYDSWYESIEGMTISEVQEFVDKKFPEYNAVCVLDGVPEKEYSIAVKKTMELNMDLFVVPKMIDVGITNSRIYVCKSVSIL